MLKRSSGVIAAVSARAAASAFSNVSKRRIGDESGLGACLGMTHSFAHPFVSGQMYTSPTGSSRRSLIS
jgi:hypothetical protein